MRRATHRFHSSREDEPAFPEPDRIGSERDRLQRGATGHVHGEGRHRLGQAESPTDLARHVHPAPRLEDLAEDHLADFGTQGFRHHCLGHGEGEIGGREGLQSPAKAADRGTFRVDEVDGGHGKRGEESDQSSSCDPRSIEPWSTRTICRTLPSIRNRITCFP